MPQPNPTPAPAILAELIVALDTTLAVGAEIALRAGTDTLDEFEQQTAKARNVLDRARKAGLHG